MNIYAFLSICAVALTYLVSIRKQLTCTPHKFDQVSRSYDLYCGYTTCFICRNCGVTRKAKD